MHPWVLSERLAVTVGKTPYVHFDLNDYSVPNTLVRRALAVLAGEHTVRILDGTTEVALHPQSWSQAEQIEQGSHVKALVAHKRQARAHRAVDRPVQPDPVAARHRGAVCQRHFKIPRSVPMSEYDPTGLRTQADELRLYDLLAHWPEVLDSPLVAQAGPGRLRVPADTARGTLAALRPRVQQAWRDQLRAGPMPDFDPDGPF